jgi:hypothetical protein
MDDQRKLCQPERSFSTTPQTRLAGTTNAAFAITRFIVYTTLAAMITLLLEETLNYSNDDNERTEHSVLI